MSNINSEDHNDWLLAIQNVKPMNSNVVVEVPNVKPKIIKSIKDTVFTHDLHGMTVDSAFHYTMDLIEESFEYNISELRIITGKSGSIFREFSSWMHTPYFRQFVRGVSIEANGGSYLVFLLNK
jgi:hypothetical protein